MRGIEIHHGWNEFGHDLFRCGIGVDLNIHVSRLVMPDRDDVLRFVENISFLVQIVSLTQLVSTGGDPIGMKVEPQYISRRRIEGGVSNGTFTVSDLAHD